jgi:hypothetical protein
MILKAMPIVTPKVTMTNRMTSCFVRGVMRFI